ncbi:RICIN domain-containing protein [Streptomyces sp. NPDC046805]|uniref:RICIN domain-containing protein n=1 Tax=Streptomyces sp. NPDC046805 TaxID=3155134 RepID=UPI0034082ABE
MNDAGLPNSPGPVRTSGITDEQLSAELKKWTGTTSAPHPVGELLDRHWEAAFSYALLCTDGARAAGMLTTAAFTRLFGELLRHTGPATAWRPQLLLTVRRITAEWDTDGRREQLHPALRSAAAAGDRAAARLLPPSDRRLLSRAFQRLPQASRALLWHTEVEAEPLAVPAALLGLDEEDARVELRRARERLREECLQVHRELAPEDECLRYMRMLDVTYRRGGVDVDPDLRLHIDGCRHCLHTADQLDQFNGGLGLALAEAVLGWGALAYLEVRAGLTEQPAAHAPAQPAVARPAIGPWTASRSPSRTPAPSPRPATPVRRSVPRAALRAARRARRRNLVAAVATVSGLVVLPLLLWAVVGSDDGGAPAAAGGKPTGTPAPGSPTPVPSWVGAGATAQGDLRGRLHNVASGLCVGVVGEKAVKGAQTELATCSSATSQQWSYETDGLLRNGAAPGLCLDSHLGYSVRLAPCAGASRHGAKDIRYDFTLQGALVPRGNQDLALTPAATDGGGDLVLKNRTDATVQRWVIDTSKPDLQLQVVDWDGGSRSSSTPTTAEPAPRATGTPSRTPSPSSSEPNSGPEPSSSPSWSSQGAGPVDGCDYHPYSCGSGGQYGGYGGYGGGYGGRYGGWGR